MFNKKEIIKLALNHTINAIVLIVVGIVGSRYVVSELTEKQRTKMNNNLGNQNQALQELVHNQRKLWKGLEEMGIEVDMDEIVIPPSEQVNNNPRTPGSIRNPASISFVGEKCVVVPYANYLDCPCSQNNSKNKKLELLKNQ